jgi:hypothetical protein
MSAMVTPARDLGVVVDGCLAGPDADEPHRPARELLDPLDVARAAGGNSSNDRQPVMSSCQPGKRLVDALDAVEFRGLEVLERFAVLA